MLLLSILFKALFLLRYDGTRGVRDFLLIYCSRFKLQVDSIEMSFCFVEWFFDDFESTHDVIFFKKRNTHIDTSD